MTNYIPMRTLYRIVGTSIVSHSFPLLCTASGDGLTLDKSFIAQRFNGKSPHTLFKEIEVVPRLETLTKSARDFFAKDLRIYKEDEDHYLHMVAMSLIKAIYDGWDTVSSHIILHSSGLDSRLVSHAIRQLYHEYGPEWLGRVVFVCSKWEQSEFVKIMQYEGWAESQYYCPGMNAKPSEYYAPELLDFVNLWKRTGSVSAIPVNLFYWLGERAQQKFNLPTPIQLITSQYGNSLDVLSGPARNKGAEYKHHQYYNSVFTQRPMYGDSLLCPFLNLSLNSIICSSSVRLGKNLRPKLLAYVDPNLATFNNLNADGDRHRRIADWIMKDIMDNYRDSWYGTRVQPNAKPRHKTTEFQPFWAHYCAASLCEYLRKSGIEVKV